MSVEEKFNGSEAREKLRQAIYGLDMSGFDPSPWLDENVIRPLQGAQERFLTCKAQVVFYGGAAGSGKSEGLVLDQIQHTDDPNWESVTFRRSTKQLKGAGGIFNKAGKVFKRLGAEQKLADLKYVWPSGATSRYCHMEHNERTAEDDHQGLEYSAIYYDEIGRFNRAAFFYMLSRLRSNADSQSFVKATCNPEAPEAEGGWLHEFLADYYLDEHGYAIPERSGDIRWFITDDDGNLTWGNSKEELQALYGLDCDPMSFSFISATILDNPVLCKLQPAYLTALKNLGRVERERLLYGCWKVSAQGTGYLKREWLDFVDLKDVPKRIKTIRCWDLAAAVESEINKDPDFTAGVKISLCDDGYFYIEHSTELRARPAGVQAKIMETSKIDGKKVPVGIPLDVGGAGLVQFENYARPLILSGIAVKKMKTRKGKLERFLPFSNAAENGMVKIVKGEWNDKYIGQLENFDPDRKRQHDDLVDATSDCYNWLTSGKKLPEKFIFKTSALTKTTKYRPD